MRSIPSSPRYDSEDEVHTLPDESDLDSLQRISEFQEYTQRMQLLARDRLAEEEDFPDLRRRTTPLREEEEEEVTEREVADALEEAAEWLLSLRRQL